MGKEKYICISYACEDLDRVKENVDAMAEKNSVYVVAGGENNSDVLDKEVKDIVSGCDLFIAFRSGAYDKSQFCIALFANAANAIGAKKLRIVKLDKSLAKKDMQRSGISRSFMNSIPDYSVSIALDRLQRDLERCSNDEPWREEYISNHFVEAKRTEQPKQPKQPRTEEKKKEFVFTKKDIALNKLEEKMELFEDKPWDKKRKIFEDIQSTYKTEYHERSFAVLYAEAMSLLLHANCKTETGGFLVDEEEQNKFLDELWDLYDEYMDEDFAEYLSLSYSYSLANVTELEKIIEAIRQIKRIRYDDGFQTEFTATALAAALCIAVQHGTTTPAMIDVLIKKIEMLFSVHPTVNIAITLAVVHTERILATAKESIIKEHIERLHELYSNYHNIGITENFAEGLSLAMPCSKSLELRETWKQMLLDIAAENLHNPMIDKHVVEGMNQYFKKMRMDDDAINQAYHQLLDGDIESEGLCFVYLDRLKKSCETKKMELSKCLDEANMTFASCENENVALHYTDFLVLAATIAIKQKADNKIIDGILEELESLDGQFENDGITDNYATVLKFCLFHLGKKECLEDLKKLAKQDTTLQYIVKIYKSIGDWSAMDKIYQEIAQQYKVASIARTVVEPLMIILEYIGLENPQRIDACLEEMEKIFENDEFRDEKTAVPYRELLIAKEVQTDYSKSRKYRSKRKYLERKYIRNTISEPWK